MSDLEPMGAPDIPIAMPSLASAHMACCWQGEHGQTCDAESTHWQWLYGELCGYHARMVDETTTNQKAKSRRLK